MGQIRTFVGVKVSKSIQASAGRCIGRLEVSNAGYNWVAPDNVHVTLNFVGDLDEKEVPDLCREVKKEAEKHAPFLLTVEGMGAFPEAVRPRTIWLGVSEGADALRALHRDLAIVIQGFGFNKERNEYCPHLTLGRVRRNGRWNQVLTDAIDRMNDHEAGSCSVDEISVFSSHRDRFGPTYSVMSTIELLG